MNFRFNASLVTLGMVLSTVAFSLQSIPPVLAAQSMPNTTTSWYVQCLSDSATTIENWAYTKGAELGNQVRDLAGTQDNVVILHFGAPTFSGNEYGATCSPSSTWVIKNSEIQVVAKKYAQGYYDGVNSGSNPDKTSQLKLAIGTSNSGNGVSSSHAKAWAQMIKSIGTWLAVDKGSTVGKQVKVRGASDMEISYNSPTVTRAWVDAYKNEIQGTEYVLYNVGDAQSCPQSGSTASSAACGATGWSQEDVYYISKGSGYLNAIPEIYSTAGGNAKSWQQISLYSKLKYNAALDMIKGPLSQYGACSQRTCIDVGNSPTNAWTQLWDRLNSDSRTAQNLTWSTDIRWRVK